jgi:hypothetical protein
MNEPFDGAQGLERVFGSKRQSTRRGFLVTLGRLAALAGLGALAARLAGRVPDENAQGAAPCGRCGALSRCNLPDGVKAREGACASRSGSGPDPFFSARGLCGRRPDGVLVSRWVRREGP